MSTIKGVDFVQMLKFSDIMAFTDDELAEMARADAEIDAMDMTDEDYAYTDFIEKELLFPSNSTRGQAYYRANKEKFRNYGKSYYEANRDKILAYDKIYYEANKDKIKAYHKAYYIANKNRIKAHDKAYYEAKKNKHSTESPTLKNEGKV